MCALQLRIELMGFFGIGWARRTEALVYYLGKVVIFRAKWCIPCKSRVCTNC